MRSFFSVLRNDLDVTIEMTGTDGDLPGGYLAIVVSRYHESITSKLLEGCLKTLRDAGIDDERMIICRVPGAWELVLPAINFASSEAIVGVIALGAVIRGETTHDQHINRAVTVSLMNLSINTNTAVALGLLTCNSVEQAIQRSGGSMGNKGVEAAQAMLEMLRLAVKIDEILATDDEDAE